MVGYVSHNMKPSLALWHTASLYKSETPPKVWFPPLPTRTATGASSMAMRRVGAPSTGFMFQTHHDTLPVEHHPGIYEDRRGNRFYVKSSVVSSPETPNSGIRAQHVAHKLYGILATPENHIAPMESRLYADSNGGKPLAPDHHITPHEPLYITTPELTGAHTHADFLGIRPDGTSGPKVPTSQNVEHNLSHGFVVDAFLGASDIGADNVMSHPHKPGVYRIDTGGTLGHTSLGQKLPESSGLFHDPHIEHLPMLPELVSLGAKTHFTGEEMLDKISQAIHTYHTRRPEIIQAIQDHHDPQKLLDTLDRRVRSLQKTHEAYKAIPHQLHADIHAMDAVRKEQEKSKRTWVDAFVSRLASGMDAAHKRYQQEGKQ